ncbi:chemotaxis protein CheB [Algivirga pacifica]|uniref:protein-glutamate methylesterase n=1 Tax=Algivirga pacifica TaxID=1162670 RepID=A0ABP9DES4_9BACT
MGRNRAHKKYQAVVIGGSAGSFQPINELLEALPRGFSLPVFLCLHRLKTVRHGFVEALSIRSAKEVREPMDKEKIQGGIVYLAPSNYHMCVEQDDCISLSTDELVNNSRPSIDVTFETAAYAYGEGLLAILLSGANDDGAEGMYWVKEKGGTTVIQDPEECSMNTMPKAAAKHAEIDYTLSYKEIIDLLIKLTV